MGRFTLLNAVLLGLTLLYQATLISSIECSKFGSLPPSTGCTLLSIKPAEKDAKCGVYTAEESYTCPWPGQAETCTRQYYKKCKTNAECTDEMKKGYESTGKTTMCQKVGYGFTYDIYKKKASNNNAKDPEFIACDPKGCCCEHRIVGGGGDGPWLCTDTLIAKTKKWGLCHPGNIA